MGGQFSYPYIRLLFYKNSVYNMLFINLLKFHGKSRDYSKCKIVCVCGVCVCVTFVLQKSIKIKILWFITVLKYLWFEIF